MQAHNLLSAPNPSPELSQAISQMAWISGSLIGGAAISILTSSHHITVSALPSYCRGAASSAGVQDKQKPQTLHKELQHLCLIYFYTLDDDRRHYVNSEIPFALERN
jgi:hypothetical protein